MKIKKIDITEDLTGLTFRHTGSGYFEVHSYENKRPMYEKWLKFDEFDIRVTGKIEVNADEEIIDVLYLDCEVQDKESEPLDIEVTFDLDEVLKNINLESTFWIDIVIVIVFLILFK